MSPLIFKGASIFGAGLLTSLTPCVYPMIPITLGYLGSSQKEGSNKKVVFGFFIGQVIAFTLLGVLAVSLGEVFGFSSELKSVQYGTALFLFLFAYFSYKGELPGFVNKLNNLSFFKKQKAHSLIGAVFVGALSAVVASPCASPILGGVLTSIAQVGNIFTGAFLMFLYALGISIIFLALGLGLTSFAEMPKSGKWLGHVHKISTALLGGAGIYYLLLGLEVI